MNIEEFESSYNSSQLSTVKVKGMPWSKKSFLLNNQNAKFRDKRLMNRFKRMVYDFDHSVNFYNTESSSGNRHKGASHLSTATERLKTGEAKLTVDRMKETFTSFRHMEKCPLSDQSRFTELHAERRSVQESKGFST